MRKRRRRRKKQIVWISLLWSTPPVFCAKFFTPRIGHSFAPGGKTIVRWRKARPDFLAFWRKNRIFVASFLGNYECQALWAKHFCCVCPIWKANVLKSESCCSISRPQISLLLAESTLHDTKHGSPWIRINEMTRGYPWSSCNRATWLTSKPKLLNCFSAALAWHYQGSMLSSVTACLYFHSNWRKIAK